MSLKVWIKKHAADRVLAPLRLEILEYFNQGDSVLDVGCGTGDLLFQAGNKINRGYGIDLDQEMIWFAENEKHKKKMHHLSFECVNALDITDEAFDVSTSTLCLHEMGIDAATKVLGKMLEISTNVVIADYSKPRSASGSLGIEFDEMISGHYGRFRAYRKYGGIPSIAESIRATVVSETPSSIDGITLWLLSSRG